MKDDVLSGFSAVFDVIGGQIDPEKMKEVVPQAVVADDDYEEPVDLTPQDAEIDFLGTGIDIADDEADDKTIAGTDDTADGVQSDDDLAPALFDAIAESVGWSLGEGVDKPKDIDGLLSTIKTMVESGSAPKYANDDVAAIDEYVKNGGSISDYIQAVASSADLDNIDITNEYTQKAVISEFLYEKGFTEAQIKRKLEKYEEADLLEDEAIDAVESLKESRQEKKKALLEEQRNAQRVMIEEQQRFYNNVVNEVEALTDVRGIKIPKQDKQALMEYIFKVESDGRTKYQKDYAKSTKNLIESAYFTMKGDALISSARQSGETSAVEKLKKTLNSTRVTGSKQTINNRSAQPLWSVASSQLLRRP